MFMELRGTLTLFIILKIATVSPSATMTFVDAVGDEAVLPTTTAATTIKIHGGVPIESKQSSNQ